MSPFTHSHQMWNLPACLWRLLHCKKVSCNVVAFADIRSESSALYVKGFSPVCVNRWTLFIHATIWLMVMASFMWLWKKVSQMRNWWEKWHGWTGWYATIDRAVGTGPVCPAIAGPLFVHLMNNCYVQGVVVSFAHRPMHGVRAQSDGNTAA